MPDEQYDHRSLFDRLEEQRRKKEYEYEETHKLSECIVLLITIVNVLDARTDWTS